MTPPATRTAPTTASAAADTPARASRSRTSSIRSSAPAASSGPASRVRRGQDALISVRIELRDAVFGVNRKLEVDTAVTCPTCNGSCCREGSHPERCDICGGSGQVQRAVRSILGQVMTAAPCGSLRRLRHCHQGSLQRVQRPGPHPQPPLTDHQGALPASPRAPGSSCPGRARQVRPAALPATSTSRSGSTTTPPMSVTAMTCTRRCTFR